MFSAPQGLVGATILVLWLGGGSAKESKTRSTIELAHFRYLFSERRCSLTPIRGNVNLDFEQKRFVDLGHGIIRPDAF